MVLGILQFEVLIPDPESLKDKRRVVQSLKDRLHREHLCAVAEVGDPDLMSVAVLGLAVVGREGQRVGEVLDQISLKLRALREAEVGEIHREIVKGEALAAGAAETIGTGASDDATPGIQAAEGLKDELLAYFEKGERPADPKPPPR